MSSVPPSYEHPGSPPPRPELPEGVWRPDPPARAPDELPRWPLWSPFAGMLLALIVTVVGVGVIALIVEATGTSVDEDTPGLTIGGTYLQDLSLIGVAVLLARLLDPPVSGRQFGLRATPLRAAAGWTLLAYVSFFVFATVWSVALGIDETDDLPEELGADSSTAALVLVAILVCVAAPLAEEIFFRGFCFTALRRRLGMLPAAALTGIIFGAIHLGGTEIEFIVPLMVFGALLCLLYVWTNSLLPCIVLHALNNGLALGVAEDWGGWTPVAMVGAALVCLAIAHPFTTRSRTVPA